jgi:hypothetical protein
VTYFMITLLVVQQLVALVVVLQALRLARQRGR